MNVEPDKARVPNDHGGACHRAQPAPDGVHLQRVPLDKELGAVAVEVLFSGLQELFPHHGSRGGRLPVAGQAGVTEVQLAVEALAGQVSPGAFEQGHNPLATCVYDAGVGQDL